MNRWLDCIQIWYGCSLGISNDLINFWDESIKKKMAAQGSKVWDDQQSGKDEFSFWQLIPALKE